jgi:hypothetical protein
MMCQVTILHPTGVIGQIFSVSVSSAPANSGNSGANQIWDLTTLATDSIVNYQIINPSGSTAIGTTNMVYQSKYDAECFYDSPSIRQLMGIVVDTLSIIYTVPEVYLRYPVSYNASYSDPWAAGFSYGGYNYLEAGISTSNVDGYGTLNLPNGSTYNNVLRIHRSNNYKDSVEFVSEFITKKITSVDDYQWYAQDVNYPLATVGTITSYTQTTYHGTVINSSSPTTTYQAQYLVNISTGVNEVSQNKRGITIWPNPATDYFTVNTTENATVSVISFNNCTVLEKEIHGSTPIPISSLPKGVYLVKIKTNTGFSIEKLTVR